MLFHEKKTHVKVNVKKYGICLKFDKTSSIPKCPYHFETILNSLLNMYKNNFRENIHLCSDLKHLFFKDFHESADKQGHRRTGPDWLVMISIFVFYQTQTLSLMHHIFKFNGAKDFACPSFHKQ